MTFSPFAYYSTEGEENLQESVIYISFGRKHPTIVRIKLIAVVSGSCCIVKQDTEGYG